MDGTEALGSIAEVGAAFIGFVAILTVLSGRDGRLAATDRLRVQGIMVTSVVATLCALLPFSLHELGLTGSLIWRTSSACAMLAIVAGAVAQRRTERHANRAGESWFRDMATAVVISWSCAVVAILAFGLNMLGVLGAPSSGLYVLGLLLCLAVGATTFLSFVFHRFL